MLLVVLVLIFYSIVGCSYISADFEDTRFLLGTVVSIKAFGEEAKMAVLDGFRKMEELELQFDQYSQNGAVTKLNNYFGKQSNTELKPVKISKDLCNATKLGLDYSAKTNGKYDITIRPLTEYWERKEREGVLPLQEEINKIKNLIAHEKVELDIEQSTIKIEQGMGLDLGSVAKGYIIDQAMHKMKEYNITGVIINAGGNILTMGENVEGKWSIGLINPQEIDSLVGHLSFKGDKAVASSGNYQQYYLINDQRYGHILNIETGWPATGIAGVTVIGPYSAEADILSTGAFIVGVEAGLDLIEDAGYEGLIIEHSGELHVTKGFNKYFHRIKY